MLSRSIIFASFVATVSLGRAAAFLGPNPTVTDVIRRFQLMAAEPVDDSEAQHLEVDESLAASGAAGAMVGMAVMGPIGAALGGAVAAYATKKDAGAIGDIARAAGEVAMDAKSKAMDLNKKHHIMDRAKQISKEAWEKAKDLDREHKLLDKAEATLTDISVFSINETVKFAKDKKILERGAEVTGKSVKFMAEKATEIATKSLLDSQGGLKLPKFDLPEPEFKPSK